MVKGCKIVFLILYLFCFFSCESKDIKIEEMNISEAREYYDNDNIVGRIEIEGTSINEYIFQSEDNSYYLNHNRDNKEDIKGEIFLDYRVSLSDRIILIYGHNSTFMKTPFKELEKYENKDFFKKYSDINIYTNDIKVTYRIFSVYVEDEDYSYMNINYEDDEYLEHINYLKDNSWYNSDVSLNGNDRIVILQTCSFNKKYGKNKYLLVIGKEI